MMVRTRVNTRSECGLVKSPGVMFAESAPRMNATTNAPHEHLSKPLRAVLTIVSCDVVRYPHPHEPTVRTHHNGGTTDLVTIRMISTTNNTPDTCQTALNAFPDVYTQQRTNAHDDTQTPVKPTTGASWANSC